MANKASTLQKLAGVWRGSHDAAPATEFVTKLEHGWQTGAASNAYFDAAPTVAVPFTVTTYDGFSSRQLHLTVDI